MKSPLTTTLFTEHDDYRRPPTSFAVSFLLHSAIISLIAFGVFYNPPIMVRNSLDRYAVRHLDLEMPIVPPRHAPQNNFHAPGVHQSSAHQLASNGAQPEKSLVMPPVPHAKRSPQTLIQPDVHTDITLAQEAPLPQIVLWTPAKMPVANIVAPLPAKPPTLAVKPMLTQPNQEPNLGNIAISSVAQPKLNQLLVPSNTTPIVVRGPQNPTPTPATVTQNTAKPTPAAVISLSDVKLKNGSVALPPVNEAAASNTNDAATLSPGPPKPVATAGNGAPGSKSEGSGTGKIEGAHSGEGAANTPGSGSSPAKFTVAGPDQPEGATNGTGDGDQPSLTAISLPKDGSFGSVIVGNSLEDQYPEIGDVWKGRMAYTVYLHVGLEKSWILQYALPRSDAAGAGGIVRLDAPWPYSIVRPNLPSDAITTDALMIHGFVNNAGRFETLSIVFPAQFAEAQFVLDSLARWQFRPAAENGQIAKVEVLLIIPEQFE